MKIGDKVNVYDDPLTCQRFAGRATIKDMYFYVQGEGAVCRVEFDDEKDATYVRRIVYPLGHNDSQS